jgi:ribosomal protein L7Ae-like RNA K-turn-binding protein
MILRRKKKPPFEGGGLLLFEKVEEAIRAEKVLKGENYTVKLVAPPPTLRKGCDLAVEINLVEQMGIERLFRQKGVPYFEVVSLKGTGALLEIVKITNFKDATMVKAGNMKLTFDRNTGIILNASGGGCPDIPYLHIQLIDKLLTEAPRPKEIGFTLCALMLDRALVECMELWRRRGI